MMIGLGLGLGANAGSNGSKAATPLQTFGALDWWYRADNYVPGTWTDTSGNTRHATQGTGSLQPTLVPSAINGWPSVRGDGVDDFLQATWARVAPGTQPFYIRMILKQISYVTSGGLLGDFNANGFIIRAQTGVSPQYQMYNGAYTNTNAGAVLGSWVRLEAQFDNTTASYLKIGATNVTGGNPLNVAGGGTLRLFGLGPVGGSVSNIEIAEAFCFLGTPTTQRGLQDTADVARYGGTLVV